MDPKKLAALRKKFTSATSLDFTNPKFKRVADVQINKDGTRALPYGGIPTILEAPHQTTLDGLEVALIGVPMDLAVTNRNGSRFGPRAVRTQERVGPYNHVLDVVPTAELKCADVGDVPMRSRFNLEMCHQDIETYYKAVRAAGVIPVSIGGDHSITWPILKGLAEGEPVGCIHIDAHADTSGEYEQSRFHHGGPFRNAVLDNALDPERTIQIGIRGSAEYLWEFSYESGMTIIHAETFAEIGVEAVLKQALAVIGDKPFYISIDVDAFDPAFTPGTGTPEVGGLYPREVQRLLRGLAGLPVMGGDVVEIAPQYDPTSNTAQVGTQMAHEILSLIAVRKKTIGL
ncbi:MAG: agmatinase [Rhodobacteraceae bacterium]|nr:agmatinase [Paracoccaceae bacterium]